MAVVQVLDDLQSLQLVLGSQTVAALGLHGGGTQAQHLVQSLGGLLGQLLLGGAAGGVGGGLDAAAGVLDLQIGLAVQLHAQLVLAPAAEDQVGMRVDQTGSDQLALSVDDLGVSDLGSSPGADLSDHAVLDQDPGVLQDLDVALLSAGLGGLTHGGCQHTNIGQQ